MSLAGLSDTADPDCLGLQPSRHEPTGTADEQFLPQLRAHDEIVSYLELGISSDAPFWARRQSRISLESWRIWTETIETAQLLVSELVTNAVKYAGVESRAVPAETDACEYVSLILRYRAGRLTILVSDPDPNPPVLADAASDAEGGRGLMLVEALSKDWGHYLPAAGGKVVYCVLAATAGP